MALPQSAYHILSTSTRSCLHELHVDKDPQDIISRNACDFEETGHREKELVASLKHQSLYAISNSLHGLHLSHKNRRRRSAWLTRRSILFFQRRRQKKLPRRLIHNRHMLSRLSSFVPNTNKSEDEESILRGVIGYVQGMQKQLKDIRADIALLQSNKSKTDQKNTARCATVQTTFDTYDISNDVRQASEKEGCGYGDDKKVIQRKAEAEYNICANMLQALHVKEVNEKTFHVQIRCKREAGVLQRLTKTLESLQLPMDFHSANLNAVDDYFISNVFIKTRAPMKAEMLKQVIQDATLQMLNPKIKPFLFCC